ncbi:hypothetical protein BpHYR1_025189 [Brachionus plicatilis]|uniref:Uncharacterized protein n=1 Tax=Brachionus plicatilis TaxID=10195 RepID=A0A3M7SNY4_BRAPC|nr:hypothetical protein BpHYR1_025189 [Brachionus plicatilis]
MKISVEKSCSVVFSRYKKESDNLNLKIYGNRIVSQKEIKFLGALARLNIVRVAFLNIKKKFRFGYIVSMTVSWFWIFFYLGYYFYKELNTICLRLLH